MMPVADWFEATVLRMKEITKNSEMVDLFGPSSGKLRGETNTSWLSRIGPLFLQVREGESKDDAIETLVEIAAIEPPNQGESVYSWFERVQPHIENHNTSLS